MIITDTREQTPLDFRPWNLETIRAGLKTGDYSLAGLEDVVTVERKSLPDLLACVGRERDRFEAELERMRAFPHAALVIEADLREVLAGHDLSLVHPNAAIGSLAAWSVKFARLPVWFAYDRRHAAALVVKILRAAHKYLNPSKES